MTLQPILILIIVVFVLGIFLGFMIGFSRAMREAAKTTQSKIRPVMAWNVVGIGCLALIGALVTSLYTWHFTRIAERTTGTVIEMVPHAGHDPNGDAYAPTPTFRFQDARGVQHTVASHFSSSPEFHVGDSVKVLYLPNDPQRARIDTCLQVWGLLIGLGIFGGYSLPLGLVMLFWPTITARFRAQSAR